MIRVRPGEGLALQLPSEELTTRKVAAGQTGGAYSLFEVEVRPGAGSQPQVRHREEECFYVLEGDFEFVGDGGKAAAGAGSLVYVLRGHLRSYRNVGEKNGRLLAIQTPGGAYEGYVGEIGEQITGGVRPKSPPELERLAIVAARYGIEIVTQGTT